MKFNFFKNDILPRGVRKLITPSPEFSEKAKGRFLAAFDVRYPTAHLAAYPTRFVFALRVAAGTLAAAIIMFGGVSAYADTKNVPADSPLYSLKRLSESVRLVVAPPAAKVQLQAGFAERRVAEINDLGGRKPTSTIIADLVDDADDAVNASIAGADKANIQDGQLSALCGSIFSTVATSSATLQGEILNHPNILEHFTAQCEEVNNNDRGGDNGDRNGSTAAGVASPATASATVNTNAATSSGSSQKGDQPSMPNLELRIRTYLDRHLPLSTTTPSVTVSASGSGGDEHGGVKINSDHGLLQD
jgi:hypothetical protein